MEKSKLYESFYILKSNLTDEELKKAILDLKRKFDDLSIKNLAYEVMHYKKGYFINVEFRATEQEVLELERYCRIKDVILKYCILKKYNRRTK